MVLVMFMLTIFVINIVRESIIQAFSYIHAINTSTQLAAYSARVR